MRLLGRVCINVCVYALKHREYNIHQPFLVRFDLSAYQKKTHSAKFIISYQDLLLLDHNLANDLMYQFTEL